MVARACGAGLTGAGLAAGRAAPCLPPADCARRRARAASRPLDFRLSLIAMDFPGGLGPNAALASAAALEHDERQTLALGVVVVAEEADMVVGVGAMAGLELGDHIG